MTLSKITPLKALLLFLAIALVSGTYWAASYINQQQDKVAEWVSAQLGYPVEIGTAKLSWRSLSPKLALTSVKVLGEKNAPPLLTLQALYFDLDFYDSIRFADLRIDNITIEGLKLGVVRDEFGLLSLQGLNQQGDSTPLFAELLVRSDNLDSFNLASITVDYIDKGHPALTGRYQVSQAMVKHVSTKWHAEGQIGLPSKLGRQVQFGVDWLLNTTQPELTTWQWSVDVDQAVLDSLRPYLVWQQLMLKQGRIDLALTGKGRGYDMHTADVTFDLEQGHLSHQLGEFSSVIVEKLSGQAHWLRHDTGWALSVQQLQCQIEDKVWPKSSFRFEQYAQRSVVEGSFLDIQNVLDIAKLTGQLPAQIIGQNPQGEISQYRIDYDDELGLQQAEFELRDGALNQWQSYPGVDNVHLDANLKDNMLRVDVLSNNVTLYPGQALDEPLFFDAIAGKVTVERKQDNAWVVISQDVIVTNPDLTVKVDGNSRISPTGEINNDVTIKVADVSMARWKSYVPQAGLHADFKKWSDEAFHAGTITQGDITLKGDLAAFPYQTDADKQRGSFDMSMQVEGVHLHYADHWPDLFDIKGVVSGQGHNLVIQSQQANIAGFNVQDVRVDIDHLLEHNPILTAKGRLLGSTQQAVNFLQNSPLNQRFGSVATQMAAKGQSQLNLLLTVPLTHSIDTDVAGDIRFMNSVLYPKAMPELALKQVNGTLQFNNQGVSAKQIQAQWLANPIMVDVVPKENNTVIEAKTRTAISQLRQQWPDIPSFMQGTMDYQVDVSVSERQLGDFYIDVALTSALQGVEVDLPAPFGKTATQSMASKLVFNQSQRQPFYQLSYGEQQIVAKPNQDEVFSFENGSVQLALSAVDLAAWQQWTQQSTSTTRAPSLQEIDLKVQKLTGFDQAWSDVAIHALSDAKQWQVSLTSPTMSGQIDIPKDWQQGVLKVRLDKLALRSAQNGKTSTISSSKQALWPAMDVMIEQLSFDDLFLGKATLYAHVDDNQWSLDKAQLQSPSYLTEITGHWQQSTQSERSSMIVKATSPDMAGLLKQLNYQPIIMAADSELTASVSWPGSPVDFAKEALTGQLKFNLRKGKLNQVEPGAAGRVFGLMSITAIPRRLSLDFSELFGKGLNFSVLQGQFDIANGQANVDQLNLRGEAANIDMTGSIDLARENYDQIVKVTPNVSSTLPLAGAVAGGPVGLGVGAAIFLADKIAGKLFDKNIVNMVSYTYRLTGSWQEPELHVVGPTLAQ